MPRFLSRPRSWAEPVLMGRVIRGQRKGPGSVFHAHVEHRDGLRDCAPGIPLSGSATQEHREGHHPPPRPRRTPCQRGLLGSAQVYGADGAVHCRQGRSHGPLCVLQQEGPARHWQYAPCGHCACGYDRVLPGREAWRPWQAGSGIGELCHCYLPIPETRKTRVKLPSGSKKAGRAYHKYKAKRNCWPRVRGVAVNPAENPFGGGKHQHIGKPSTIRRDVPASRRVGLLPVGLDVSGEPGLHRRERTSAEGLSKVRLYAKTKLNKRKQWPERTDV
ncbi:60S ribosomal protein L8 [Plecturocebus cupreus]